MPACAGAIQAGDQLTTTLVAYPTPAAGWTTGSSNGIWNTSTGNATLTTDSTTQYDGQQSLIMTAGTGTASFKLYYDNAGENISILHNGTYQLCMYAKTVSGSPVLTAGVARASAGGINVSMTPTLSGGSTWTQYCQSFAATETAASTSMGSVAASFSVTGGTLEIDDVSFQKTNNQDATNTTPYRDEVVNTLRAWCATSNAGARCPIRDWVNQNGETMANWVLPISKAAQTVAGPANVTGGTPTLQLPDYLNLVKIVGGVPYLEVPPTFTATESQELIEYLESTNTATGYGYTRAQSGQSAPWVGPTGVFPEIYLSMCNECWNDAAGGVAQNIPYRAAAPTYYGDYAAWSGLMISTMRADSAYVASATHFGFGIQEGLPNQLSTTFATMAATGALLIM